MKTTKEARAARRKRQRQIKAIAVSLVGVALLLAVAGLLLKQNPSVPVEVTGAPSLKVDTEHVDLGDVRLGQTVQVSFQLTNVGDQPLRLAKAPYVQVVEGC